MSTTMTLATAPAAQPFHAQAALRSAAATAATTRTTAVERLSPGLRRLRRAEVAQRLIDLAPAAVEAIDWDTLDQAPDWLALPEAALLILQARVGALLHLPAMRLWIDGPRLAATRVLLGDAVMDDLLAHPESAMPFGLTPCARIESAAQVGPALRATGLSVLLAALPHGALREALCRALAPVAASRMTPELAETLIVRARALGQGA